MKRSELNQVIREAIAFVEGKGLCFPAFAKWGPEDWAKIGEDERELVDNMLGWDVSDFGGNFAKTGLLIFTFRNGNFNDKATYPKPYAEKLLLVGDGQELPYHFHWSKMEDIINRGGGVLMMQLYRRERGLRGYGRPCDDRRQAGHGSRGRERHPAPGPEHHADARPVPQLGGRARNRPRDAV